MDVVVSLLTDGRHKYKRMSIVQASAYIMSDSGGIHERQRVDIIIKATKYPYTFNK